MSEHTHDHTHDHTHEHTHHHDPKQRQAVINRIARAGGHLNAVRKMVEHDRDCSEILIQLAAVRSEINGTGKALLKEHLNHCIVEAVEEHDHESIEKMNRAIDQFMK